MSANEVEQSDAAVEPHFEFAVPSDATVSVIPESPAISSVPSSEDRSFCSVLDTIETKTSTPKDDDLEDAESDAAEEEKVETDVQGEEMLTDDEDSIPEFTSFAENLASEKEVPTNSAPTCVLSNLMEISEDDSEQNENEEDHAASNDSFASFAASNESFASAANESFYSTHMHKSPDASNVSYASALDATWVVDDDDNDDDNDPIIKKRLSKINMEHSHESFDLDDLCSEQISPSKFWAPPALSKVSRQPEPSTSDVDLR